MTYYDLPLAKENEQWIAQYHGAGDGRLLIDMSLHAEYTSTPEVVRTLADATKAAGLRMQVHVSETQKEVQECIERHGKTPPVYLADLGLFDVPTTADHCVWLTDEDRSVLVERAYSLRAVPPRTRSGSGIADIKANEAAGMHAHAGAPMAWRATTTTTCSKTFTCSRSCSARAMRTPSRFLLKSLSESQHATARFRRVVLIADVCR